MRHWKANAVGGREAERHLGVGEKFSWRKCAFGLETNEDEITKRKSEGRGLEPRRRVWSTSHLSDLNFSHWDYSKEQRNQNLDSNPNFGFQPPEAGWQSKRM